MRGVTRMLLAAVLIVPMAAACTKDGPVNPVGDVLGSLEETVNGVLAEAGRQGQALTVTAAGQVLLAIDNLESALAADLDKATDQLDDAARRSLDDVRALADRLTSSAEEVLNEAITGAQQLINSLPFTNRNPQVRSYTPRVATAAAAGTVQVTVDGNFFWASQNKLEVTLRAAGATYRPNESTTSRVGFALPAELFRRTPAGLDRVTLELVAPYESGVVFRSRPLGVFRLLVTVLPAAPAKSMTLTNETAVNGVETVTRTAPSDALAGGGWRLDSWVRCRDESDNHTIAPDPGWTIVPSSVTVGYHQQTPDAIMAGAALDAVQPTGFAVNGFTKARCFLGISNGSGTVIYYVTYAQQRTVTTSQSVTGPLPAMAWGDQIEVPVSRGRWRIRAELWNGAVLETTGSITDNPYLLVEDRGDHVRLRFRVPANAAAI